MKSFPWALAFALVLGVQSARADSGAPSVTEYHNSPERSGHFVVPGLTWDRARKLRRFAEFRTDIAGHVYAQPLYWHPPGSGSGLLIAATESNTVYGLDADSGATVWKKWLGRPVSSSALSCGNIDPVGITGTPAIGSDSQTIYLDAFVRGQAEEIGLARHRAGIVEVRRDRPAPAAPHGGESTEIAGLHRHALRRSNGWRDLDPVGDRFRHDISFMKILPDTHIWHPNPAICAEKTEFASAPA